MANESYMKGFKAYLKLEQHLSEATIEAYLHDVRLFLRYYRGCEAGEQGKGDEGDEGDAAPSIDFRAVSPQQVECFMGFLMEIGMGAASQARILAGIKNFFNYLVLESVLVNSPAELIESPKLKRHLPDVLSYEEIIRIFDLIDLSTVEGRRNRAMLELMYACGLRVSELVNLRISMLYFDEGFVRVIGKGDKERLVPIGRDAVKQVRSYLENDRVHIDIQKGSEDIVFLNRYGRGLTRVMVFKLIKRYVAEAGIRKQVSPHTFRHSFATHLVEGGADLRSVQDMLGHESITTTEIYTHLDRRYLQDTIALYHPLSRH